MCDEAEQVTGVFVNAELPKSFIKVTGAHEFDASEFVEDVGDLR